MFILLAHEMGHYLCARHYRVNATLPFFIPFPSLIGTFGAFIRIKSPIPTRAALFDIGIAGPIAGFIPSCAAVLVGLSLSRPLMFAGPLDNEPGFPGAFYLAARLLHLDVPVTSLSLHPIAVAGWVGMFATALNLLPGGQLDGGHICFPCSQITQVGFPGGGDCAHPVSQILLGRMADLGGGLVAHQPASADSRSP